MGGGGSCGSLNSLWEKSTFLFLSSVNGNILEIPVWLKGVSISTDLKNFPCDVHESIS